MRLELPERRIVGPAGELIFPPDDVITPRLIMLIEGQCEGLGAAEAAAQARPQQAAIFSSCSNSIVNREAQDSKATSPAPNATMSAPTRSIRQVIRHRFLDPDASVDVIAQKLRQAGFPVSTRSVDRVIEEYGLQKKTLSLPPGL